MTPRIFIDVKLEAGRSAEISQEQVHYLKNVLRRRVGDAVLIFNGADGEFAAQISRLEKKCGAVDVLELRRKQTVERGPGLLFAPVKKTAVDLIVQKAVELGASHLAPVKTERAQISSVNQRRLNAVALEAAEQCGRMTRPLVEPMQSLTELLREWTPDRRIMFCDEAGDDEEAQWGGEKGRAPPAAKALVDFTPGAERWSILIGPEGGFTPDERTLLRDSAFVTPVTLGPLILRADTAAISALTIWQSVLGEWRGGDDHA